jgi:preprotein translocase subunit SecA
MNRLGVEETTPIENRTLSKALENAQKKVESMNFDSRKNVVQYDDVMNRHRKATYSRRQAVLTSEDISEFVLEAIEQQVAAIVGADQDKPAELKKELSALATLGEAQLKKIIKAQPESRAEVAIATTKDAYRAREQDITPSELRKLERLIYLQTLDAAWMQHLENMQHLREGIGWRSIGQRDPLVEYRREGQRFFEQMQSEIANNIVQILFRAQPAPEAQEVIETELTRAAEHAVEGGGETKEQRKDDRRKAKKAAVKDEAATAKRDAAPTKGSRQSKAARKRQKKARRKK